MRSELELIAFEFEGVCVRPVHGGMDDDLYVSDVREGERVRMKHARALHAFIEAEPAEWRWVEDGKVARKGRWTAELQEGVWVFVHDDFMRPGRGPSPYWTRIVGSGERRVDDVVTVVMDSFDAWQAAQSQPAEPTTFGYVGTVTDSDGGVWDVMRDGSFPVKHRYLIERISDGTYRPGQHWSEVLALGTFEPVTR